MPTLKIDIDVKVINPIYRPYIDDTHYRQIFYGGSSSGKSYFLAQRCIIDMLRGGHNYLILRKVGRTLRKSTFNEIQKAISFFKVSHLFDVNKTDMVITGPNGYQIMFAGADDREKIKSITPAKGVITDIWTEEATEFEYEDIKQLEKRLRGKAAVVKRMILSFNPIYKTHWIFKEYFAGHWMDDSREYHDDINTILKTTYRDNAFLTADDITALENESDQYYKSVYCDGNWGTLGKAIFTNWETRDLSQQEFSSYCNAIDFGFAADPTAMVRVHYEEKTSTVYIKDARYRFGYTNDLIASEAREMFGTELITCDCAEPKSIAELRQYGLTTTAAQKGKDSVNHGIQWLQKMHIVIDSSLVEAVNEFTIYQWAQDKDGNVLPKPIDKNNHKSFTGAVTAQAQSYYAPSKLLDYAQNLYLPSQNQYNTMYAGRMGSAGTTSATTQSTDGNSSLWGAAGQLGSAAILACFTGDTLVATPKGEKPIKEIKAGDEVLSLDNDDRVIVCRVLAVNKPVMQPIVSVSFDNGAKWKTTDTQRVYTCPWFEYVGRAKKMAVSMSGKTKILETAETKEHDFVYDIVVEDRNIFFANGIAAEGYGD